MSMGSQSVSSVRAIICLLSWLLLHFFVKQDNERTDMANDAESGGEFVLVVFWQYGTHNIIWLAVMSNSVSEQTCSLPHTYGSSSNRSLT